MTPDSSRSMGPLLGRTHRSLVFRSVVLVWIAAATVSIGWQEGTGTFFEAPRGLRYLFTIIALAAVGGVAAIRSRGPAGALAAMVSALALTAIAWTAAYAGDAVD